MITHIKNTIIIFLLVLFIVFLTNKCNASANDLALIENYDTTYVDIRDTSLLHRQIYINDLFNRKQIYMLYNMRKDSIVKEYRWIQKY